MRNHKYFTAHTRGGLTFIGAGSIGVTVYRRRYQGPAVALVSSLIGLALAPWIAIAVIVL